MIKHTVMFRLKKDISEERRKTLINEYMVFPKIFPSMRNFSFGKNISERDNTFEYALSVEFEREEDLKDYLNSKHHEEHVTERFRPSIESRAIVSFVDTVPYGGGRAVQQFLDWNAVLWERVRDGVERKGFSGQGVTIAMNRLAPGHEPRPHSHPHEQIAYIVSGNVRFHVGGDVYSLGPDQLLSIPPNVEHWAEVVGDEPVVNIDVFAPARPEYSS